MEQLAAPLLGGVLIGSASVLLMATLGRVAGISGIVASILPPQAEADSGWRFAFLFGLLVGPVLVALVAGSSRIGPTIAPLPVLAGAGLLVGLGTGLGRGCTSGHGVCGMALLSPRSVVATLTFMAAGVATVFLVRHVI